MNVLTEYIIPFNGMKIGKYQFDYKIGKEFFDAFEYSEIKDGSLDVVVELDKSDTMMVMNFELKGVVVLECDICLGDVNNTMSREYRQVFKFSNDEDLNLNDELTLVRSSEFEINVAPFIVEFINLSKPNKSSHEDGACDEDLVSVLDEYLLVEEKIEEEEEEEEEKESIEDEEVDPRWNALKKLKNK